MKKILGISLVALFAVAPMMANAAAGNVNKDPSSVSPQPADAEAAATAYLTPSSATPYFALQSADDGDHNVVSAGYVKGAYNAAIKAVNKVYEDAMTAASYTEGDGIDITNNTVSVDFTADKGLAVDSSTHKLEIKDGAGIKTGANGVEVDLQSKAGLGIDNNGQLGVLVDDSTIDLDASGQVHLKNGIQNATDTATYSGVGLTTQGYVDEQIADKATQIGVVKTVNAAKLNVLTEWGSSAVIPTSQIISVDSYVAQ